MVDKVNLQIDLVEIDGKLQRLVDVIEMIKASQEQVAENVSEIKKAVYGPDTGIYARIRELESWKSAQTKLVWLAATSLLGIFTAITINYILNG
tara:strand:- start:3693 stop:3974 length:282 start_codon:yes stop_codon:yes gene_type:complete